MQKVGIIQEALDFVGNTWLNRICAVRNSINNGEKIDFTQSIKEIQSTLDKMPGPYNYDFTYPSPLETLYLKISQFERIGELRDFISVNQYKFCTDYSVSQKFVKRMEEWKHTIIKCTCAEQFVKDNFDEIAQYVYLKDKPIEEERTRMRRNIWKIPLLLKCCVHINPKVIINGEVTVLRIVSCLQAVLTDKDENFNYHFYLMQEHFAHLTNVVQKERHTVEAIQLFWVQRINNHFNASLGEYEIRYNLEQYENKIYELLSKLYSCSNIPEMMNLNKMLSVVISQPAQPDCL